MTRTTKTTGKRSAGFQPAAAGGRQKAQAGSPRYVERPFVLVNMAMTADGKIATANRTVSSFGSKRDLENLYALRATADAILCGARTADTPGVTLGTGGIRFERARLRRGLAPHALRIVVSGSGSLSPRAGVFKPSKAPLLIVTTARAGATRLRRLAKLAESVHLAGREQIEWEPLLHWLAAERGVRRLLVEGGGELNAELFRAGLVDELHLTICPLIFGGRTAPTIAAGANPESLAEAFQLKLCSMKRRGGELFCVFARAA